MHEFDRQTDCQTDGQTERPQQELVSNVVRCAKTGIDCFLNNNNNYYYYYYYYHCCRNVTGICD